MPALNAGGIEQGKAFLFSNYTDLFHTCEEGLICVLNLAGKTASASVNLGPGKAEPSFLGPSWLAAISSI